MDQEIVENAEALIVDNYRMTAMHIVVGDEKFPAIMMEFSNSATDEMRPVLFMGTNETMREFGSHIKQAVSTACLIAAQLDTKA